MRFLMLVVIVLLFIGGLYYTAFIFKRNWNYAWGYESQVQETICEMVKRDQLVNPNQCD